MKDEKKQELIAEVIDSIKRLDDDNLQKLSKFIAGLEAVKLRIGNKEAGEKNDS